MRLGLGTVLPLLCSLILAAPAFAQTSPWQVLTQQGGYRVARVVGSGMASGLALTCDRGTPVIALNLAAGPARGPSTVTVLVDGSAFPLTLVRNGTTHVWVAAVRDPRLIEALAEGSSARVMAGAAAIGTFSLGGAKAAIAQALAPCHRLAAAPTMPSAAPSGMPPLVEEGRGCPSLEPVKRWGKANVPRWMDADAVFCGDFNGDGAPDALAFVSYEMGGNSAGQVIALFQNSGGTLRFLRKADDIDGQAAKAGFRRGKVLAQMTVPRPGDARCCPSGVAWQEIDVATGRAATVVAPARGRGPPPRPW